MAEYMSYPATIEHAKLIATDLQEDVKAEVYASGGYTPLEACKAAIKGSTRAWAGYLYGELAVIYGITECKSNVVMEFVVPWAITGNAVVKYPIAYFKGSKNFIEWAKMHYVYMVNMVDARREHALKWNKRLGFKVGEPEPFGKFQMPFCKIEMWSVGTKACV